MSTFVTSDTHFNHVNMVEKFCQESRQFDTVEEMNEAIVKNWNSVVSPDDTVYHLGDCFMGPLETVAEYGSRLNGKIHVIPGNHDTKKRIAEMEKLGWIIENKVSCIDYNDVSFIMIHERPEQMLGDSANIILSMMRLQMVLLIGRITLVLTRITLLLLTFMTFGSMFR